MPENFIDVYCNSLRIFSGQILRSVFYYLQLRINHKQGMTDADL